MVAFAQKHKPKFSRIQEGCLVFIIFITFSNTFDKGSDATVGDFFIMLLITILMLLTVFAFSWFVLKVIWKNDIGLRVMGFYGCHHKTVAMGLPLINAIYEDNPKIGMYVLPLLIWHPL